MPNKANIDLLRQRYVQALTAGDADEARRVVDDAIDRGFDQATVYFSIFSPALAHIGDAWVRGELNIAVEHHATSITLHEIARVGEIVRSDRRRPNDGTVIVAAVEGEMHCVGVWMLSELFQMSGWNVAQLDQDNPRDDLVEVARQRQPDLVVLSFTLPDRVGAVLDTARMLKTLEPPPAVLVGGPATVLSALREVVDVDFVTADPLEALNEAEMLIRDRSGPATLDEHLAVFGARVLHIRRRRGWSQTELARRASLDRTYISNVEKGRQNVTIGVALKIADALGSSLSELIGRN